ncbi:MAG: hypothetical protein ACJA0Y_000688 [Maricaulis maris]|jgi:hypothetical protein
MARTLEEIDADLTTYRSRLAKALDPDRFETMKHNGREVSRGRLDAATVGMIKTEIRKLEIERARLTGTGLPHRPYTPGGLVG